MENGNEENEEEKPKPKKKKERKLKEIERLAFTVGVIDRDTTVCPVGSVLLTPTKTVVKNREFQGLSSVEARDLQSYLLLREPKLESTQYRIRVNSLSNNPRFLDTLQDEQPKGEWEGDLVECVA